MNSGVTSRRRARVACLWTICTVAAAATAGAQNVQGGQGRLLTERELTTVAGRGPSPATGPYDNLPGLSTPLGTIFAGALDPSGTFLYIADYTGNTVRRLNLATGLMTRVAGQEGTADYGGDGGPAAASYLNAPAALAFDPSGNLYIADYGNSAIRRIDPTGKITTVSGIPKSPGYKNGAAGVSLLDRPISLLMSSSNLLYIGEEGNGTVRTYNPATGITDTLFSGGAAGSSVQMNPAGLAEGPNGLYISDYANHLILLYNGSAVSVFAGTTRGYGGDGGPKEAAKFIYPRGLSYDGNGTLSIADLGNARVRQIAVTAGADFAVGTIRTVAGDGAMLGYGLPALKVSATKPIYPQGFIPPPYGLVGYGSELFIMGGYPPSTLSSSAGTGSVIRLSREDGTVVPRFTSAPFASYLNFELPANTRWDSVTVDGNPGIYINTIIDCDLGSQYTTRQLCKIVMGVTADAGPATAYVTVGTTIGGATSYTRFSVVAESSKDNGIVLPQGVTSQDLSTLPVSGGAQVVHPSSAILNQSGEPVFTDSGSNQLYVLRGGTIVLLAGNVGNGSSDGRDPLSANLNAPSAVVHAANGLYYIADTGNHVVRALDVLHNSIVTVAGNGTTDPPLDGVNGVASSLNTPVALALQRDGSLLIADAGANRVRRLDNHTGVITTVAGNGTAAHTGDGGLAAAAALNAPDGIAVASLGEIYISEKDAHDVRRIDPVTGIITTYAGSTNGAAGNSGDFAAPLSALFNQPGALYTDPSGALLVADIANNQVRYITHPISTSSQTSKVLPYLTTGTSALRSIAPGVVLDGVTLKRPNGGSLLFTSPGSQYLTAVNTGSLAPAYGSQYYPSVSIDMGAPNFTVASVSAGSAYQDCSLFTNNGLLNGEACQAMIVFQPQDQAPKSGSGTVGNPYRVSAPFLLNGTSVPPLALVASSLPDAIRNQPYNATAGTLSGGSQPYGSVTVTAGALPDGIAAALDGSAVKLTGTPTATGSFSFTLGITDAVNTSVTQAYTLKVADAVPITVMEVVHVTDTVIISPAVQVVDNETVHVTDAVSVAPAVQIVDNEAVHVTDTVSARSGQTITAPVIGAHTYGEAPFSVAATSSSGLPVTIMVSGNAVLSGTTLDLTGSGPVTITYTQAGNQTYAPASTSRNFSVAAAPLAVRADDLSRAFGKPNPPLTYSILGLVHGDTAAALGGQPTRSTSAVPNSPAGIYPIVISAGALSNPNYSYSFIAGRLTVTGNVAQSITFAPIPNLPKLPVPLTLTAHATSGLTVTYTVTGPASIVKNKLTLNGTGTVTVTAHQAGNATFAPAPDVVRTFQVKP